MCVCMTIGEHFREYLLKNKDKLVFRFGISAPMLLGLFRHWLGTAILYGVSTWREIGLSVDPVTELLK